ncbi:MAG TPA: type II toxin-antitoxin system HicB family antitoxin [Xanthomonadales bacterium]|nr:type II toxin-antitoxin system HicB family antitoxin [Xanthomonadales bacterium]
MNKNKTLEIQEYELPISIKEEKTGGFVASCPIWKEVYAQGETVEDAISEISYVASSMIELYKEEDIKIPLKIKSKAQKERKGFTLKFPLIVSTN